MLPLLLLRPEFAIVSSHYSRCIDVDDFRCFGDSVEESGG